MHHHVFKRNEIDKEMHLITKVLLIFLNFQLNQIRVKLSCILKSSIYTNIVLATTTKNGNKLLQKFPKIINGEFYA